MAIETSEPNLCGAFVRTLGGEELPLTAIEHVDARVAAVAAAQFGPISLDQLRACGLSGRAVRARAARGRLHRLHRSVYTIGHTHLGQRGVWAGALLACGPGSALSWLSAAAARQLRPDRRAVIDVSVARRHGRRHRLILCHSAVALRPRDVTVVDGLPMTAIARTLLDCAAVLRPQALVRVCQEAEHRRVFDLAEIEDLLTHVPGHRGAARLRAAVETAAGASGLTEGPPEDVLLEAFRASRLPEPECNASIQRSDGSWARADFLWRKQRLIVEADPRSTHNRVDAYRGDRRRDRALLRTGFVTLRFSDEDMLDPVACAREVVDHLRERG